MTLVLIGGGGHARVVAEVATAAGFRLLGVLTPAAPADGLERLGGDDWLDQAPPETAVHIAFGPRSGNRARADMFERARRLGLGLPPIVSPAATVSGSATIASGALVVHGAIVNAGTKIGANVIVNTGAIVEHDCTIGDHSHVAPGAIVAGGAAIGAHCLIGAGCVILPGVTIADGVVVGAGAVVTHSIGEPASVWVGNPARRQT